MEEIKLTQSEEYGKAVEILSKFFRETENMTARLAEACRSAKKDHDPDN